MASDTYAMHFTRLYFPCRWLLSLVRDFACLETTTGTCNVVCTMLTSLCFSMWHLPLEQWETTHRAPKPSSVFDHGLHSRIPDCASAHEPYVAFGPGTRPVDYCACNRQRQTNLQHVCRCCAFWTARWGVGRGEDQHPPPMDTERRHGLWGVVHLAQQERVSKQYSVWRCLQCLDSWRTCQVALWLCRTTV